VRPRSAADLERSSHDRFINSTSAFISVPRAKEENVFGEIRLACEIFTFPLGKLSDKDV
jgi:hypothetical protein